MSSTMLKVIAMVTMLIDHAGCILFNNNQIMRGIGRLAFPIYCFLLVEGYFHTKNLKKYMIRLAIFGLISELPYDLMLKVSGISKTYITLTSQNVYFTLLIGLVMIDAMERVHKKYGEEKKGREEWIQLGISMLAVIVAVLLGVDYSSLGILIIYGFYSYPKQYVMQAVSLILMTILLMKGLVSQLYSVFAIPIISRYNGEKGNDHGMKYVFYWFYPVHILILCGIKMLL